MATDRKEVSRVETLLARYEVHVGARWAANRRKLAAALVLTGRSSLLTDEALTWRRQEARRQGRIALGAALAEFLADDAWPEVLEEHARTLRPAPRRAGADDPLEIALRREADLEGITVDALRERRRLDRVCADLVEGRLQVDEAEKEAGGRAGLEEAVRGALVRSPWRGVSTLEELLAELARDQAERRARWDRRRALAQGGA